jgi:alkyl sulfatase BDS1-like metallo-beta-lactamase superfamily hydrolase
MFSGNYRQHSGFSGRQLLTLFFVPLRLKPHNGEKYLVEMSSATFTNIKDQQAKNPDLTITVNRADLIQVMMGTNTFDNLIKDGKAKF